MRSAFQRWFVFSSNLLWLQKSLPCCATAEMGYCGILMIFDWRSAGALWSTHAAASLFLFLPPSWYKVDNVNEEGKEWASPHTTVPTLPNTPNFLPQPSTPPNSPQLPSNPTEILDFPQQPPDHPPHTSHLPPIPSSLPLIPTNTRIPHPQLSPNPSPHLPPPPSCRRHTLSRCYVIQLPQWKADPETNAELLFQHKQLVLVLYPQTTCFFCALIRVPPQQVQPQIQPFPYQKWALSPPQCHLLLAFAPKLSFPPSAVLGVIPQTLAPRLRTVCPEMALQSPFVTSNCTSTKMPSFHNKCLPWCPCLASKASSKASLFHPVFQPQTISFHPKLQVHILAISPQIQLPKPPYFIPNTSPKSLLFSPKL